MRVIITEQVSKLLLENNWKEVSSEDEDWALDFLDKNVDETWDMSNFGYFIVDVSGRHSVYYTLWRYKPTKTPHINPMTFWQNLSQDFRSAIEKAKRIAGAVPVILDKTGTKSALGKRSERISFGKYKDQFFSDVFQSDPQYFTWVWKKIKSGELKLSGHNIDLFEYYNNMYWETVKQKNIETSTSKHVGTVGDEFEGELTVTKISQPKSGAYGEYRVYTLVDGETNQFSTYNLEKVVGKEVKVGDKFKLKGKIDGHKDFLGINQTLLKRVKLA